MADWTLIQTQYEILGKTVEELSKAHHVKPDILNAAIINQGWKLNTVVVDDDLNEALANKSSSMQIQHQATLMPRYIEIETIFLSRLKTLAGSFAEAKDAKMIAETLALLKPAVMKQADSEAGQGGNSGGMKIAIVNKFAIPQPGDQDYIAPNAVILGDHARQHNGINRDVRMQHGEITTIEIDIPDMQDMN